VELELHRIELRHGDLRIRDEGRRRRVLASVAEAGQQVPVIVVAEGERYVLIDGSLRVEAARRLARDTVEATVWPLSESEALIEHHHLSSAPRSALEEGWLCARLRDQGLGLEEVARRLCRSKSWVSRRLGLVGELGGVVEERVRAGTIPPHAAMQYLLALTRVNRRQCEALVEALGHRRVTDREVAALYEGWRRADRTGRERLVADPVLFLRALAAQLALTEAAGTDRTSALVKELTTLSAVAWRARRHLRDEGIALEAKYSDLDLRAAWRAAESAFGALRAAWKEASIDAGSDHAHDDPQAP
jgi:ParB family transcriptional regulator, chromosome partitioning protein